MKISKVTKLNNIELAQIVIFHQTLLPESFLNKLSQTFIESFYEASVKDKNNLFYLIHDGENVLGFLLGTIDNQQFMKRVFFKSPLKFSFEIIKLILTNIDDFLILIQSIFKFNSEESEAELQFIAVDKNYQGQKLGTKLVSQFKQDLRKVNINYFIVGTQSGNQNSNKFYQKLGYSLVKQKKIFGQKINFYSSK